MKLFSFSQFVIVMACISYGPISLYGNVYPKWADDLGLCMSVTVIAVVPIYAAYAIIKDVINGKNVFDVSSISTSSVYSELNVNEICNVVLLYAILLRSSLHTSSYIHQCVRTCVRACVCVCARTMTKV